MQSDNHRKFSRHFRIMICLTTKVFRPPETPELGFLGKLINFNFIAYTKWVKGFTFYLVGERYIKSERERFARLSFFIWDMLWWVASFFLDKESNTPREKEAKVCLISATRKILTWRLASKKQRKTHHIFPMSPVTGKYFTSAICFFITFLIHRYSDDLFFISSSKAAIFLKEKLKTD